VQQASQYLYARAYRATLMAGRRPVRRLVGDDETGNFATATGLVLIIQGSDGELQGEWLMSNRNPPRTILTY